LLEVCIDSVESAIATERGGAERVELCADLFEGRITAGAGLIAAVCRRIGFGLFVMIRPCGGDFCYTDLEFKVMRDEIEHARKLEEDGIVLGLLDHDACVDVMRTICVLATASTFLCGAPRHISREHPDPCGGLDWHEFPSRFLSRTVSWRQAAMIKITIKRSFL
jgi:copper homeostasis protein CutC